MSFVLLEGARPTIDKDADASLVYGINVVDVLGAGDSVSGVSIDSSTGVTAAAPAVNGTVLSVRVSGGRAGTLGSVTLAWTTTDGDSDQRTIFFAITQR